MSIQFRLNRDATKLTINKHTRPNGKKAIDKIATINFTSPYLDLPQSLSEDETIQTQKWIREQKQLIEEAYRIYAQVGLYGGTPVVSESGEFNAQYKFLRNFNRDAPAYSFLGCIKGARRLALDAHSPDSAYFSKLINQEKLPLMMKSIIGSYCHSLSSKTDEYAKSAWSDKELSQLIEASQLLSKFIATARIKQADIRKKGVDKRVNDYFEELKKTREGYLVGKKLKVSTLLNQFDNPGAKKTTNKSIEVISDEERELLNNSNMVSQTTIKSNENNSIEDFITKCRNRN